MSPAASEAGLQGTWIPIAADVSGQPLVVAELRVKRFVLRDGVYEIFDSGDRLADTGDYNVDDTVSPQELDILFVTGPNAGRQMRAIYALEGDRLTVCYDLESDRRPANMEPEQDQLLLCITYARAATRLS